MVLALPVTLIAQSESIQFPYQAFVVQDKATVHSGPGAVHYATDELTVDSVVEVYRHDPGGWCAIRPPKGSFSLIPASAINLIGDRVGEIEIDGIQAWVGTRLGAVENPLWQVKLNENERVQILGELSWPNPEGHSTSWFQVSPPAGEFRWIRKADIKPPVLQNQLPDAIAAKPIRSAESDIPTDIQTDGRFNNRVAQASYQDDPAFEESLDPPSTQNTTVNQGWKQATTPIRIADRRVASIPTEPFKIPAIDSPSKVEPITGGGYKRPAATEPAKPTTAAVQNSSPILEEKLAPLSGPVSQRLLVLDASLTTEMLKSPDEWDLETILNQATSVSTASSDIRERQQAVRLIKKIRKCIAIQSNFENVYTDNRLDDTLIGVVGTGVDSQVQLGTRYDAHGWLNQLVRGKGNLEPTYVLENDKGEIIFHVGPAPGLNLNRYLKSKVGVIGKRGYHRELKMNHVTADRVVVLDSTRR